MADYKGISGENVQPEKLNLVCFKLGKSKVICIGEIDYDMTFYILFFPDIFISH